MTVCVATMSVEGAIACAADRMLTRGTTQTEPNLRKIYNFQTPIAVTVMWAGSAVMFGEVLQACIAAALASPDKYTTIKNYVDLYCDSFKGALGERARRAVLGPLGLSVFDLVSAKVTNDRAKFLMQEVRDYSQAVDDEDSVSVIIAGHDSLGAHIWRIVDAQP